MKKCIVIFLLLLANTAFANTWVIFNEESGINYYDQSSLDMHAFDRTVKVLNNAPKAEDGVASTTSTVQIDCRLGTFQVLSWQEFSEKMATGKIVKESKKSSGTFFILPGTLEFELKLKLCK
uniref:surface-adhesin E family protein n=1 Tax=Polynucleobacter sp. TaxID=2029855 RepID=UPI0040474B57